MTIGDWFRSHDLATLTWTERALDARPDQRFALSSLPGWRSTNSVLDSGRFSPRSGAWISQTLPVDLGIFSSKDEDHLAALTWLSELLEQAHASALRARPAAVEPLRETFYCEARCANGRAWTPAMASALKLQLAAYESWRTLFAACAPEADDSDEWLTLAELHSRLTSSWSQQAGRQCARIFESYQSAFRRAAANIAVPGLDYLHMLLTWLGVVMSYRVTLAQLAHRDKTAAEQAHGSAPEALPLTPKVQPRITHGDLGSIGVDSYKDIPGLMLGWWNVVGKDGMEEVEQRARFYLCLTSMADYGARYQNLGLGGSLELPAELDFPALGHAAWRHAVGNHGICFQRDMDAVASSAPYEIVDACFTGWLSDYPPQTRVGAMVAMGYSNYGVWAFPEPKGLTEMLCGAWNMMLAVLAPSFTDIDAEAATLETGTLCRALTPRAASQLIGHMSEYLPLGPDNDDSTDRMLLSGMSYCWWGERGNVYARVQRLAAHLQGRPIPDTPALAEWDKLQAGAANAVRSQTAAGRSLIQHSRERSASDHDVGRPTPAACECAERLERELAYILHGLDSCSAGARGTSDLSEALQKELLLWYATPALRATMIANTPNTRLAIRRLLRAAMQPGAAQDIMLQAFCRGYVRCRASRPDSG